MKAREDRVLLWTQINHECSLVDSSGGCLLKAITPQMVRSASPSILVQSKAFNGHASEYRSVAAGQGGEGREAGFQTRVVQAAGTNSEMPNRKKPVAGKGAAAFTLDRKGWTARIPAAPRIGSARALRFPRSS